MRTALSRRIDNTAPTVALVNPGAVLHGVVPLAATAADAGSGVQRVLFEYARAGVPGWAALGTAERRRRS